MYMYDKTPWHGISMFRIIISLPSLYIPTYCIYLGRGRVSFNGLPAPSMVFFRIFVALGGGGNRRKDGIFKNTITSLFT